MKHVRSLKNKTALITGGGGGIGRAIAQCFAHEGAHIGVVDIESEEGMQTVQEVQKRGGKAHFIQADVASSEDAEYAVNHLVETYGGLDILVNNAGVCFVRPISKLTEEEWDQTIDINLKGTFLFSKHTAPYMQQRGGGAIINISSGLGVYGGACWSAYCASKGGIIALTKALAVELAPQNIRANCILPGPVHTDMLKRNTRMQAKCAGLKGPEDIYDLMQKMIPLQRIATPDDIARAALYLASDESSYVTGTDLCVDGGYLAT